MIKKPQWTHWFVDGQYTQPNGCHTKMILNIDGYEARLWEFHAAPVYILSMKGEKSYASSYRFLAVQVAPQIRDSANIKHVLIVNHFKTSDQENRSLQQPFLRHETL